MQQKGQRPPVARIYPPDIRDALVSAGQRQDITVIDMLTDELARRGLCRPRNADSQPERAGWVR